MQFEFKDKYDVDDLVKIVAELRGETGCPWDKEQNHHSIRKNLIEETYEVCEAIDNNSPEMLKEELGDLLLQVVFHTQMETEENNFDLNDVANDICHKLIIRHPHVFGDVNVATVDDVLNNWNSIKVEQKGQKTYTETLNSVPKQLPALMYSQKLSSRAAKAGYKYNSINEAMQDLKSEMSELEEAIERNDPASISEELGDVLFSAVNVADMSKADAEELLYNSAQKFLKRFAEAEAIAQNRGKDLKELSSEQLDELWQAAKNRIQEN